jgi:3-deoxy-D-manno-octulosonic-acid transferase
MHNQRDLAEAALREGAAVQVSDADALSAWVVRLCREPSVAEEKRRAGDRLLKQNTGAALECANLLARLAVGDRADICRTWDWAPPTVI